MLLRNHSFGCQLLGARIKVDGHIAGPALLAQVGIDIVRDTRDYNNVQYERSKKPPSVRPIKKNNNNNLPKRTIQRTSCLRFSSSLERQEALLSPTHCTKTSGLPKPARHFRRLTLIHRLSHSHDQERSEGFHVRDKQKDYTRNLSEPPLVPWQTTSCLPYLACGL